jgi:hypothetical protein
VILPSFSRLALAYACAYPWVGFERWPKRPWSDVASVGQRVSTAAEQLAIWGDYDRDAVGDAAPHAEAVRELLERDNPAAIYAEQALAWDVRHRSARWLPQNHPRDYSAVAHGEMFGTPDVVFLRQDGTVVVRDYKTGDTSRGRDPGAHAQLRALALCASKVFGVDSVDVQLVHVSASYAWVESDTLTAWDIEATADQLAELYHTIATASDYLPNPGAHCSYHYCPKLTVCPVWQKRIRELDDKLAAELVLTTDLAGPAQASKQWDAVRALGRILDQYEQAVKDMAKTQAIPRPGGKVLGYREQTRETIDGRRALPVLREMGLDDAAEVKVSLSAVRRAAKEAGLVQARAVQALRDAGAVSESRWTKFEEFLPKE